MKELRLRIVELRAQVRLAREWLSDVWNQIPSGIRRPCFPHCCPASLNTSVLSVLGAALHLDVALMALGVLQGDMVATQGPRSLPTPGESVCVLIAYCPISSQNTAASEACNVVSCVH